MIKKALQIALFTTLAWSLTIAPTASAAFYNFGTLDVRPVQQGESNEWFVENLKPGEQKQQFIQISNFSPETKQLDIFAADATRNEGKDFYTKGVHETSDDVSDWIHLPANKLVLKSGESRILSVNFILPQNAGVGLHTGAVVVRENGSEFASEKGVRVYMNVLGPMVESGHVTALNSTQSATTYTANVQTANTGTTDFNATYELQLRDLFGTTHQRTTNTSRTEPGTVSTTELTIQKPSFGLYNLVLTNGQETSLVGTVLFVPFWMPLALLIFLLIAIRPQIPAVDIQTIQRLLQAPELRRSFAYFGMFAIVGTFTLGATNLENDVAQAQLAHGQAVRELTSDEEAAESYELSVKWGQFRKAMLPGEKRKEWHGRIYFPNARIQIKQLLHFERSDQAEITGNKTALRFNTISGPDNDGLIIFVEPTGDDIPIVKFENYDTGEEFEFLITDYLDSAGIYPDRYWATHFKTDYGQQEKLRQQAIQLATLREIDATAELEATPPPIAQIPELENLFVEELPATREALTDVILKSDYVDEVIEENSTTKIETDRILIEALEATPEVLSEVTATPDLNFIFIPSETVNFPAQEFSFDEDKDSEQDLGTMIFVQNKDVPWNTFVGTTDFQLLSGGAVIPASALTIQPGLPTVLNNGDVNGDIVVGPERTLSGEFDRTTLVNVDATPGEKEVFVLNPKLKIRIPKGTPAGTYRGNLTITSL